MVKKVEVGDSVTYVDPRGNHLPALITSVWGEFWDTAIWTEEESRNLIENHSYYVTQSEKSREEAIAMQVGRVHTIPSVNVVVVSKEDDQTDSYGRQIVRFTSTPHRDAQAAHGNYWY